MNQIDTTEHIPPKVPCLVRKINTLHYRISSAKGYPYDRPATCHLLVPPHRSVIDLRPFGNTANINSKSHPRGPHQHFESHSPETGREIERPRAGSPNARVLEISILNLSINVAVKALSAASASAIRPGLVRLTVHWVVLAGLA